MFMNSAQRLHHLFVQFRSVRPETSVPNHPPSGVDAWSTLFDRHGPAGQELDEKAAESAMAVNQEISHLGVLLRDRGVPAELYQTHLTQLKSVTSTRSMHSHWEEIAKMVREEQIVMLQWAGVRPRPGWIRGYFGGSDSACSRDRSVDFRYRGFKTAERFKAFCTTPSTGHPQCLVEL
jgi:hypothetical protein